MPWKKLLACATGKIDEALRQKLEFVLEENRVYRTLLDRHSPHWRLHGLDQASDGTALYCLSDSRTAIVHIGNPVVIVRPESAELLISIGGKFLDGCFLCFVRQTQRG